MQASQDVIYLLVGREELINRLQVAQADVPLVTPHPSIQDILACGFYPTFPSASSASPQVAILHRDRAWRRTGNMKRGLTNHLVKRTLILLEGHVLIPAASDLQPGRRLDHGDGLGGRPTTFLDRCFLHEASHRYLGFTQNAVYMELSGDNLDFLLSAQSGAYSRQPQLQ